MANIVKIDITADVTETSRKAKVFVTFEGDKVGFVFVA